MGRWNRHRAPNYTLACFPATDRVPIYFKFSNLFWRTFCWALPFFCPTKAELHKNGFLRWKKKKLPVISCTFFLLLEYVQFSFLVVLVFACLGRFPVLLQWKRNEKTVWIFASLRISAWKEGFEILSHGAKDGWSFLYLDEHTRISQNFPHKREMEKGSFFTFWMEERGEVATCVEKFPFCPLLFWKAFSSPNFLVSLFPRGLSCLDLLFFSRISCSFFGVCSTQFPRKREGRKLVIVKRIWEKSFRRRCHPCTTGEIASSKTEERGGERVIQ